MENKNQYAQYDKSLFEFAQLNDRITDKKFDTKAISYLHDAFNRFKKNKASLVASFIILLLVLFAIFGPMFSPYKVSDNDSRFAFSLPKISLAEKYNWDFWDGCSEKEVTKNNFDYYYAIGLESNNTHNPIKNNEYTTYLDEKSGKTYYKFRLDSYEKNGMIFMNVSEEEFKQIQAYQDEHNVQIIYPATKYKERPGYNTDKKFPNDPDVDPSLTSFYSDANYWYKTKVIDGKVVADLDENGNFQNIYRSKKGDDGYTSKMLIEGEEKLYNYSFKNQTGYEIRVNYYEYYCYMHAIANDGITRPLFLLGSTATGQDIYTCLGTGARLSFIVAIIVSAVNLFVGAIYGAIEGYYGGTLDLVMERVSDVLSGVPFMIVITLLKYHLDSASNLICLFIAFFITGWIGMASRVRMQFYRNKNQEYVLAARTLGAKDARLMFKHIFPNSLGTIITGSILVIPSVIFSESNLSYLGIINLNSGNTTSVGTLLSGGQPHLATYPHIIFAPAVFISLLMLSFNLFGNGLRDAFNPSLRGSED